MLAWGRAGLPKCRQALSKQDVTAPIPTVRDKATSTLSNHAKNSVEKHLPDGDKSPTSFEVELQFPPAETRNRLMHVQPAAVTDLFLDTEILPPGSCYIPLDPAARNIPLRGKLLCTYTVLSINSAFFLLSLVDTSALVVSCIRLHRSLFVGEGFTTWTNNPMIGPSSEPLIMMGGLSKSLVTTTPLGPWRLILAGFLHAGES